MATPANDHEYLQRRDGPYQSQHGEDVWLEKYFRGKTDGFFVDVGAYDGVVISNTYYFEQIGWRGVLVEPNARKAALCRENRPRSQVFECAAVSSADIKQITLIDVPGGEVYSSTVGSDFNAQRLRDYGLTATEVSVPARTLDAILAEIAPPRIDFVSIDVEGAELEVLKGFDIRRWRPGLVMIESQTARAPEISRYFTAAGYVYFHSININDVYRPLPRALPSNPKVATKIATIIDDVSYRASRIVRRAREVVRLRTRLRKLGLWS